ncbi:E3 ubiquitin-protein ligase DCST1 [Lampris incognitus]|uniref:E3 ubiquitin-protein ligase DCST1 n=1 Tax=Lampris incognitus TaxID=2546036 RepID=UPI0024B55007|nr:E3 ubiquitin-protein ligase DCST1 [Lampris incognitus]
MTDTVDPAALKQLRPPHSSLFLGLFHNLPPTFELRLTAGCIFVALCILGGVFSSYFRCSVLLMFPSMLGSRGRAYVMVFILSALSSGPLANIQRNVQDLSLSLACNLDLQVQHSKTMWRAALQPFIQVAQDIVDDSTKFQQEARNISRKFQNIRDEVIGQYGYDRFRPQPTGNNTQDQFTAKTMMQCDTVVEQGIGRCKEWFEVRWQRCMDAVKVPVISHILCVSMRFHFLCDIMRVMTRWCREEIPVEGNFGQTFDKLNHSIDMLSREFTTELFLQVQTPLLTEEQQSVVGASILQEEFRQSLRRTFQEVQTVTDQLLEILQLLLSFTFITIFTTAFGYSRQYSQDLHFDNIYITTYFRQIDNRRKSSGKRYLLPLRRSERSHFIDPWSPSIHPSELKPMVVGVLRAVSLAVLVCVFLAVDLTLYHMMDVIHRHTYSEFNLTSKTTQTHTLLKLCLSLGSHQVDIKVDGDSLMARLLRKTIAAFNSSSHFDMQTTNQNCLVQPTVMTTKQYLCSTLPVLLMVLMCFLQVYSNRLHRVIAAFYFPKREKKRILFLYNLHIQRQIHSSTRKPRPLATMVRYQATTV